ncbi:Unknown protein [Striga hermonthica]|uniref:Uncharacterized protein n=1 Tax=Striga hermonthica TaxID=68872 RepID=A0A9N7MTL0_STRHE|nr:Unknown protein [Striga hermonthica]
MEKVLQRFRMNEAKPVSTSLAYHFNLSVDQCPKSDKETHDMVEIPYASAVGCLMYAMPQQSIFTLKSQPYSAALNSPFRRSPLVAYPPALSTLLSPTAIPSSQHRPHPPEFSTPLSPSGDLNLALSLTLSIFFSFLISIHPIFLQFFC